MLEFWPDHRSGLLWTDDGNAVDLHSLGLPPDLVERLTAWNSQYAEEKVPLEGSGNSARLGEGARLLR